MKKFTLRLDERLAKKLELLAKSEKRSINNYLVFLIERESGKGADKKKTDIDNICLSYRHDFGLLSDKEKENVRFQCQEWIRALRNNYNYFENNGREL
jgi:hypothetical protein